MRSIILGLNCIWAWQPSFFNFSGFQKFRTFTLYFISEKLPTCIASSAISKFLFSSDSFVLSVVFINSCKYMSLVYDHIACFEKNAQTGIYKTLCIQSIIKFIKQVDEKDKKRGLCLPSHELDIIII